MAHEFQVGALGEQVRVSVDGMEPAEFTRLRSQWRRMAGSGSPTSTVTVVAGRRESEADVSGTDLDEVGGALRQVINHRAIRARRHDLLLLHAAGLADPSTGDVIALIGASGAGKSTAARTLGSQLGYVSDETVAVNASGEVLPFPKPLAFKQSGAPGDRLRGKRVQGPDELGLLSPDAPLRLSRIALLDRREEEIAPTIETVGLAEVAVDLIGQISYFDSLPSPLTFLDGLVRRCGGVQVMRYHHAADLIDPVRELLRRPDDVFTRAVVDDWVDVEGHVILLTGGVVSQLSPLASLTWRLLAVPQPLERLAAEAEAAFGPAGGAGATSAVRAQLDDLIGAGFVVCDRRDP